MSQGEHVMIGINGTDADLLVSTVQIGQLLIKDLMTGYMFFIYMHVFSLSKVQSTLLCKPSIDEQ